ncbi:MAG: thioredoxin domain-containing protein [Planctomycetes bacterium]|nr:thioredoxin domain-containing protein [Planctomycetota bacterium]
MTSQVSTHTNRLAHATSPYLLQHAHNPVDWFEWGQEALNRARTEDKPIFLSIGYAACHWCHVMEHESFEKDDVAAVLNKDFVSIKVDREERPDIDELYMAYTQALTGGGGWPMSVFLTPEGVPFHAGTYFPKENFMHLLAGIAEMWHGDREKILRGSQNAKSFFEQWSGGPKPDEGVISLETINKSATVLTRHFDHSLGGMSGGSNKFPPSMDMELMLRVHRRTKNVDLLDAVNVTLEHMARGGIYDHIGGGICRYSTDPQWLVPHFEKMLYDQALVSSIYLDAHQATKNREYAKVAADILDYVLTDLRSPDGAFYSSRDADSDGLEGKFYIWTVAEIKEILGKADGELCCKYFDVTATGNWFERLGHAPSGPKNILHISKPPDVFAKLNGLTTEALEAKLAIWREKLRAIRAKRTPPGLDDKILTDWNGLMIASLAKGSRVLHEPKYAEAAGNAAQFILREMRRDERLLRTYRNGQARLPGTLSDYAFLVDGLINLYEATFDQKWLDEALSLTEVTNQFFFDEKGGAYFYTASDSEKLLARSKQPQDGAIPSANSVQAMNLLRLAIFFDRKDLRIKAESIFRAFAPLVDDSPHAFERLCSAADFYHDKVKEIAIIGDPAASDTDALLRTVYERFLPNKALVGAPDKSDDTRLPLLRGKSRRQGLSTAYVCENYHCQAPVTTPEEFRSALGN